jgi:predicted porin
MLNYVNVKNGDAATKAAATSSASTTSLAGYSAKVLGLGVDYSLSKRTTIYGRHERDTDSTATFRSITGYTAATNNVTYTATAIGIRHTF